MNKKEIFVQLDEILENSNVEDMLILLNNFMSSSQLEEFLEFVKEEYGIED